MVTNVSTTNTVNTNVGAHETMAHAGQTGGGNWLQQAGSWLGSDSMSQGMGGMGGMSNGQMILAADQTGGQIFGMLAGQNETTAGNIIKSIPGLSTVGNLVNAAFGSHINEGFVKQTEFGINSAGSQAFNSNTNADVLNDWKNLTQLSHVKKSDVGSDGWFSKKAKRKTNALNEAIDEANALQLTNFGHAVANADQNTDLRIAQGMIAAYGGPINSFRKYYNDGGNLFDTPQFFTFEPQIHDDGGYLSKAKALIRQNEGWRAKPYKDAPKGKAWRSVGYGFNDSGFREKYPEGISKHYEHGITKEQAEQELEYYLRKSEKTLKNIYGKQWNSFTDNQKAAILDTYYQSPASVGKKSRFYKAVTAGEDAGKYLGVAGFSKRNNIRQGVFGGGAVPKSSGAAYSADYSNVDMASSSGTGQIDTGELSYPSPILEGRSPIVDFDLSGIEPTKVLDPKINLSRPAMDLNFMSSPITQAPQPQAPTVGTVEDFLASYGDIDDSMLFAHGGFLGRQYDGGGSYSYTKPLDNVFVDSEGNVIDPSVPSAKGTIRTPDVVIATRDPRKVVPTANVLNPSSLSLSNFLDKNKIYNRIPGDEWYNVVNEDRKSNYGISGPFDALQAYFLNDDDYVLNRLSRYMPYKNISWREKEKAAQDFDEESRKVKYKFDTLSDTAKHRLEMLQDKSEALPVLQHEDAKAVYLGLPQRTNTLRDAEYNPTQGKLNNGKYITYMREPTFVEDVLMPIYNDLKLGRKRIGGKKVVGEVLSLPKYANSIEEITPKGNAVVHIPFLNNATMSSGHDGRGEYLSIFDTWDYNTGVYAKPGDNIGKHINGKPFDIYDRIYLDDYYGTPEEYRGSTYIPEVTVIAKRRKHEFGGNLFPDGGSTGNTNGWLDFFKSWNQSQGGNNYFNMDNGWKPSDGLQRNTSNGSVQDWIGVAQTVGNTIANWGEEDPSLGRGGGYSMFGMAAYDLLKGIRDATKSKRESIDQKLGIPIYACGGRLYPDGGTLGGMGAGGGESVGAMGYAQAGAAALKLASNAVNQAKLTVDEDKIDRSINRYGYGFDEYAKNVNTNGDLLDLWQNNATVNPNLSARDFRDKSEFDDFLNSYAASWEGFNAGQNWGPWGAAIGAVVGGISSRIGSQIGKNKAKHAAEEANEEIERANERRQATLEYLAERVDHENDLRILQDMDKRNINSGASGGDLNMGFGLRNPFIMPDGVANPLYRSFGGGLTHGVNWDTGVNWVDEGGSHGENPLGGVPMGVDDQGIPNLVEEGEAIWNGDYVFSKRMKVPKKLAKKYGLGGDITFADAIKKLTKDSEERPLSMIDRDTNDHILGEFADVQEEKRMAKAQRAMEREQQLQEDFMTGFQYGLGGHLSPFGIVPNSDNISPFEKAEQQFEDGGGIHIDPSKRGTFKAQASKMGMGVQEAASHILANKENYSPAMVKKAVFAHNFAKAYGGDLFTNPFAYGGEMGNIFEGEGDRPNSFTWGTDFSSAPWVRNMQRLTSNPKSYLTFEELQAIQKAREAAKKYQEAVKQQKAQEAASNKGRSNGKKARATSTPRNTDAANAAALSAAIGPTGLNLYDWYRNGSDGYSTPTGFKVGENGKAYDYTDEYTTLVKSKTADDIRKWARKRGWKEGMTNFDDITDPSLKSFLKKGNKLENLKDDQWHTGALDGKYGFMHHVADSMLNEKAPTKKATSVAPAGVSEVEMPQQELLLVDPRIAEDPARIAKGTRTTTVDENGTKVTRITDPDTAKNNNTGNGKFKPRDTWMRQVPIWMSGLAALRGELTPPDYTNADAILSAAYAAGRPVSVGTEYVGDYRRRDPFDERYLMNIINQRGSATNRNMMNLSGGNRAVAMSGILANDLTTQMALAEAARQAYLANRADDAQVAEFNRGTNQFNATAQNQRNQFLAGLNSQRQHAMLSGISQGARLRQAIKDQRDAAISANLSAFAQNMGDWGKENGYYNMLGGLNEEGVLKYFFGDDWKTKFNNNSTV